ncbi:MAG: hypothetical protein JNG86_21325, partial [Verrucomicrobiaceae bacterium]|nr:hypothetical protein [Verrucomicrobiaceae bacterium]
IGQEFFDLEGEVSGISLELRDPARPEYRHYRLRFWDGKPFGEWSPVATIVLGNS